MKTKNLSKNLSKILTESPKIADFPVPDSIYNSQELLKFKFLARINKCALITSKGIRAGIRRGQIRTVVRDILEPDFVWVIDPKTGKLLTVFSESEVTILTGPSSEQHVT